MQDISPLTEAIFKEKTKVPFNKIEIYHEGDAAWYDLCDLGGENYLKEAEYSNGSEEFTYSPIAATFSVIIDNEDGEFHPQNPDGLYNDYLKRGVKIRFSTGFTYGGTDYSWQWFVGVISRVNFNNANRDVFIEGFDYMQYLSDFKLKGTGNYWGETTTKSTVALQSAYDLSGESPACNGVYYATLDGDPIYEGIEWVYDRDAEEFVFLPDYIPAAPGVNNLVIYYYSSQVPEEVIADLLVTARLYADQAAALTAMDYTATGETIDRVYFESGLEILTAIKKICESQDYRFYFKYDSTPVFEPIPEKDIWVNRLFTFTQDVISEPEYIENCDEVKNHIEVNGEAYSVYDQLYRIRSGEDQLDDSVEDRHLANIVCEEPYETQEVVSPTRDIIVPFYIPASILTIHDIKMNLYFPGLQDGDYPKNSPNIYLSPVNWMMLEKKDGAFVSSITEIPFQAGTGGLAGSYYWYREFLRYHIAPLFGFDIDTATLYWTLRNKVFKGAGANAQHSLDLESINDFGQPSTSMWAMATQVDHGAIQVYTDSDFAAYNADVTARIAALIAAGTGYACFRIKSDSEPTDAANANNYRHNPDFTLYCEMSEDTDEAVSVYLDDGSGFGALFNTYSSDAENIDLSAQFSGAGKKRVKITCDKTRRVDVLIRFDLALSR